MKVSFVITIFNEEKTIGSFLDSLFKQTKMLDEIVIVDAGSSDSTIAKVQSSKFKVKSYNSKLKIIIKPTATISQGRNFGIKQATGNIIVMSDAGCVLHKDWLEKITEPFLKDNVDIVAGFYRMIGSSPIQKALAVYLGISPQRFDPKEFLPSARSMAFKKSLWRKIGGFNERLDRAGEDTLFNYQAVSLGAKFVRVKDAVVDWEVPKSLWEGFKKFYIYAKGDLQVGIWWHPTQRASTHNLKIAAIFIRYLVGVTLLALSVSFNWLLYIVIFGFLFYVFWSIWKMRDVVNDFKAKLWLPIVQLISDVAIVSGVFLGFFANKQKIKRV